MKGFDCFWGKQCRRHRREGGFTLLELLLVMALIGIMAGMATWGGRQMIADWRLKKAAQQLFEDLKAVQGRAERAASLTLNNGVLVMQRTFLVFDPAAGAYAAYVWQDGNADGVADTGESALLWRNRLPSDVTFGWAAGIDRRACSNSAGAPPSAVSFASPNYAPCNDQPCIKFDHHGFSSMGPGAVYLTDGVQSLAITGTRPGHFTLCAWDGQRWK